MNINAINGDCTIQTFAVGNIFLSYHAILNHIETHMDVYNLNIIHANKIFVFTVKRFREPVGIRRPWRIWSLILNNSKELWYYDNIIAQNRAHSHSFVLPAGSLIRLSKPLALFSCILPTYSCPHSPMKIPALCESVTCLSSFIALACNYTNRITLFCFTGIYWTSCWMPHWECWWSGWGWRLFPR